MRSSSSIAGRPVTASSIRETAGAALSSAEALTALLSDSIAGRKTPSQRDVSPATTLLGGEALTALLSDSIAGRRTPSQRDVSPATTLLGGSIAARSRSVTPTSRVAKRSMLPAQVWVQQAKADTAFQSIVTYICGVTISIKDLAKVLVPLAQSNPGDLPRVADIVQRRDHIEISLNLYNECDTQCNGYLGWRGGQLYNFVVSVFRHNGFLPPFSGQVKEVADRFHVQEKEILEARECLCLVDALLQGLTYEARRKSSIADLPTEKEVVRRLDSELQASSSDKPDHRLESLIDRIESRLGNQNQLLSSVTDHWSPNRSVPSAISFSPQSKQKSTERPCTRVENSLALPTQVPSPQEVHSLVDKAQTILGSIGRPEATFSKMERGVAGAFDENKPISPKGIGLGNDAYCKTENALVEKVFRKPYENLNIGCSSIEAEKSQVDHVVAGNGHSVLSLSSVRTLAPQSEDVTHRIMMFQEKVLALDKEIAHRDQQITMLRLKHKTEVGHLNEELKKAAEEIQRKDEIILAKDKEIQALNERCNDEDIVSTDELKEQHEREVRHLKKVIERNEEEKRSQLEFIIALKKDKERLKAHYGEKERLEPQTVQSCD